MEEPEYPDERNTVLPLSMRAKIGILCTPFFAFGFLVCLLAGPFVLHVLAGGTTIDEAGDSVIWNASYFGARPSSVVGSGDGGYVVAGRIEENGMTLGPFVMKINGTGGLDWKLIANESLFNGFHDLVATGNGDYLVAGYHYSGGQEGNDDFQILRLDPSGRIVWQQTYPGAVFEDAISLAGSDETGYLVAGNVYDYEDLPVPGIGLSDIRLMKLTGNGEVVWDRTYEAEGDQWVGMRYWESFLTMAATGSKCVVESGDGGHVIAGATCPVRSVLAHGDLIPRILVMKVDSDGDMVWERSFGGTDAYLSKLLVRSPDGGYIVGGERIELVSFESDIGRGPEEFYAPGDKKIHLLKIDQNGEKVWETTFWLGGGTNGLAPTTDGGAAGIGPGAVFRVAGNGTLLSEWANPLGEGCMITLLGKDDDHIIVAGFAPCSRGQMYVCELRMQ